MSTHNIQFHDEIRKNSLNICFLELSKNFVASQKRVRIIQANKPSSQGDFTVNGKLMSVMEN